MGGGSSNSSHNSEEHEEKAKPTRPPRTGPVRGSVYHGYQPSSEFANDKYKKNKATAKDRRADYEGKSSPSVSFIYVIIHTIQNNVNLFQDKLNKYNKGSIDDPSRRLASTKDTVGDKRNDNVVSPTSLQPKITEIYVPPSTEYTNGSKRNSAPAHSFDQAPKVNINYVVKPNERNSKHTYDFGSITVARRVTSQGGTRGGKWYDNEYRENS